MAEYDSLNCLTLSRSTPQAAIVGMQLLIYLRAFTPVKLSTRRRACIKPAAGLVLCLSDLDAHHALRQWGLPSNSLRFCTTVRISSHINDSGGW